MITSFLRRVLDNELEELTARVAKVALSLHDLALAVQQLSDVTKKQQQILNAHHQTILQNSVAIELLVKKLQRSGASVDLPDIDFGNNGEGNNEPN